MIAILLAGSIATLISLFGTRYLIIFFRTRGQGQPILHEELPVTELVLQVGEELRQSVVDGVPGFGDVRITTRHASDHYRPEDPHTNCGRKLRVCVLLEP